MVRATNPEGAYRALLSKLERHLVLNRKRVSGAMHQIFDCFVYRTLPASPRSRVGVGVRGREEGANDVAENGNSGLSCQGREGRRKSAFDSALTNDFSFYSFLCFPIQPKHLMQEV